jgi:hypothetical protein
MGRRGDGVGEDGLGCRVMDEDDEDNRNDRELSLCLMFGERVIWTSWTS